MNEKSWRIDSYQEGKYTVSVRANLENDRVDEGDCPNDEHIFNDSSNSKLGKVNKPNNKE